MPRAGVLAALVVAHTAGCSPPPPLLDVLIVSGSVVDGSGSGAQDLEIGIRGDRITFVGVPGKGGEALDTIDAAGLMITPGFIDMHSHAPLTTEYGRDGLPFLHQGITTAVVGVDGGGAPNVADQLAEWQADGVGLNVLTYVGHGDVRGMVMGREDRPPDEAELDSMRVLVRKGMVEGALGLSSGLFYTPGTYAATEEVIALNRVAAEYGGIYDTHDRDLGAVYEGIGYLASIEEGIRIGEEGGTPVIFSHFNAQGARNYGRADEGAQLIEAARARGVEVWAAQHVYTATQSNLRSYTIPDWAAAGTRADMIRRFDDPDTAAILDRETMARLSIRGGAEKILFADPRPGLNGRTLAEVAEQRGLPVPEVVRAILREGNASVMNLDLYDIENTRFLALQVWMMTCTDGRTPRPDQEIAHPRPYGAFSRKLRQFVLDEALIDMPFAIRSMSGLAADFLGLEDRGYVREGYLADIAVFDVERIRDRATFEEPKRLAEGTVHVLLNGTFVMRDGEPTGVLAGRALLRGGAEYGGQ